MNRPAAGVTIVSVAKVGSQFRFEFDSRAGASHVVQYKTSLVGGGWQTLTTVTGDGTRKLVTDDAAATQRFYRVMNQ